MADIFRQLVLVALSSLKCADPEKQPEETFTIGLSDSGLKAAFHLQLDSFDAPRRAEDLDNILSLTNFLESYIADGISENRQFVDYYHLDLGLKVDIERLKASCRNLLEIFPVLSASFLPFNGKHWMVILKHLALPFYVTNIDIDLQNALADFYLHDIAILKCNRPIIAFVFSRNKSRGIRFVVYLLHAQHNGISIRVIFKALIGAYHGQKITVHTSFSIYIAYIFCEQLRSILY